MGAWNLAAVEEAFSEAAANPVAWTQALNVLTNETNSFGAIFAPVSGNHLPNIPFSDRMGETIAAYRDGTWNRRDDRNKGVLLSKDARIADGPEHVTADGTTSRPSYQDFLATTGLRWFAEIRIQCGDELWCLSVQRSARQTPFSSQEKYQLAQLSQGLSKAAAATRALGSATTNAALNAFEVSDTAVLLVDRFGKVIRFNHSAERMIEEDLAIWRGRLVVKDQSASRSVEQALLELLWERDTPLAAIPLPREGRRPLLVHPIKLPSMSANALAECQAIAILTDPDKRWIPAETTLRASFGFTAAEAKLAARVASGAALYSVTDSLGISKETGRSQLKSIFAKAGVHRQAELVAMMGSTFNTARGFLQSAYMRRTAGADPAIADAFS